MSILEFFSSLKTRPFIFLGDKSDTSVHSSARGSLPAPLHPQPWDIDKGSCSRSLCLRPTAESLTRPEMKRLHPIENYAAILFLRIYFFKCFFLVMNRIMIIKMAIIPFYLKLKLTKSRRAWRCMYSSTCIFEKFWKWAKKCEILKCSLLMLCTTLFYLQVRYTYLASLLCSWFLPRWPRIAIALHEDLNSLRLYPRFWNFCFRSCVKALIVW